MAPALLTAQDQINIRIVSGVYCALAGIITAVRFYIRGKKWWWDDWCALIALIGTLGAKACQIAVTYGVMRRTGPGSVSSKIGLNYILAITFVLELWFARISILYLIIRITKSTHWARYMHWITLFFALCALTYLFMFVGYCEHGPAWKQSALVLCFIPKYVSYFSIATALISDTILVLLPVSILGLVSKLPETRGILLMLFVASALMTVVQIVQTSMTLRQATGSIFASLTVGFIAVVMCSLPVIVMACLPGGSKKQAEENPAPSPSDSVSDVKDKEG